MSKDRVLAFELCSDGSVIVKMGEGYDLSVLENGNNEFRLVAEDFQKNVSGEGRAAKFKRISIGKPVEDGSIYVGLSKTTQKPMFIPSADEIQFFSSFKKFEDFLSNEEMHGYSDWQIPDRNECHQILDLKSIKHIKAIIGRRTMFVFERDDEYRSLRQMHIRARESHSSQGFSNNVIPIRYGK